MVTGDIRNESPDIALSGIGLLLLRILPFGGGLYAKSLRKLMDSISNQAFRSYSHYFAGMVKLTKGYSKQFRNSNRELDDVLEQFPRMNGHRGLMLSTVKAHRRKCKLQV